MAVGNGTRFHMDLHSQTQLRWSASVAYTRVSARTAPSRERVGFAGVNLCTDGRLLSVTSGV